MKTKSSESLDIICESYRIMLSLPIGMRSNVRMQKHMSQLRDYIAVATNTEPRQVQDHYEREWYESTHGR